MILFRPNGDVNSGHGQPDQEKRVRREIANSNERRRMQSINAGFDSLRILLPSIADGEKMSKVTLKFIVYCFRLPYLSWSYAWSLFVEKRPDCLRNRRQRVEAEGTYDSRQSHHFSPESTDTHQSSPLNSFNSSTSICSASPQPESTGSTAARLEHLVMAIEQIEGGGALNNSPQPESHDGSFSTGDRSPPETYWHSPQENYHGYAYVDAQTASQKPGNLFTDPLLLTPVSEINPSINSGESIQVHNTEDYPIVAKLLNRPIPHKYLHRPQVVVNSSH
ncbi:unnamed protein product [Trichobilharzia regenti]|nr:unnamed protein product [Trichobilharzia regenti]